MSASSVSQKNILVIGGNGFIGSHLVDRLLQEGCFVRVLDLAPERHRLPLSGVEYLLRDFNDPFVLAEALRDIDVVFHLASTTVPVTSNRDPLGDIQTNLSPTVRLLEQMVLSRVKRIVYVSSGGTVYGVPRCNPVGESHPLQPVCSYGVVKVAVEHYLGMYLHLHGLEPIILRPSNPYGPRQGHIGSQGVIATFLHRLKRGLPLDIWGDGTVVRDYFHVTDLVEACWLALSSGQPGVYNIGSGTGLSINDLIRTLSDVLEIEPEIANFAAKPYDVPALVLDCARGRKELGWSTTVELRAGLLETWQALSA